MSLRDILAANLEKTRRHDSPKDELLSVRAWATRRGLSVRLIDRLLKAENSVTLDTLDEVARGLGVKPWHLLLEDFDPAAPQDAPITDGERAILSRLRHLLEKG